MGELTLTVAEIIRDGALEAAADNHLSPVAIAVLDARGCLKVSAAQDGVSLLRSQIAYGKAYGALAMGVGSRALLMRAQEQSFFISAVNVMTHGQLVPVPGGVLLRDADGQLLGAVGVSGDTSDNDEKCATAAIAAAGLTADTG